MVGTAAARFHYVGQDWLEMSYQKLFFWYDLALKLNESEKKAIRDIS